MMTRAFIAIAALLVFNAGIGGVPPAAESAVVRAEEALSAAIRGASHNPVALKELTTVGSQIAPLVDQVKGDFRVPKEIKEVAEDLVDAIVCKSVLDVDQGKPFPTKEKLGVTVTSSLFARGIAVTPEARSVISNLTEAYLHQLFFREPAESAERVRLKNGCERAFSLLH